MITLARKFLIVEIPILSQVVIRTLPTRERPNQLRVRSRAYQREWMTYSGESLVASWYCSMISFCSSRPAWCIQRARRNEACTRSENDMRSIAQ